MLMREAALEMGLAHVRTHDTARAHIRSTGAREGQRRALTHARTWCATAVGGTPFTVSVPFDSIRQDRPLNFVPRKYTALRNVPG